MGREIFHCFKRKRDICVKTIIPSQNTAFAFTPALTLSVEELGLISENNLSMSVQAGGARELQPPPPLSPKLGNYVTFWVKRS